MYLFSVIFVHMQAVLHLSHGHSIYFAPEFIHGNQPSNGPKSRISLNLDKTDPVSVFQLLIDMIIRIYL